METEKKSDILRKCFVEKRRENLAYLDLNGLSYHPEVSADEDTSSPLAYLHLGGPLVQVMLSPRFRTFFDKFIPLKLDGYIDVYRDHALLRYKKTREGRILEVLVNLYERFGRLESKDQRKLLFGRVLDTLFQAQSQETEGLRKLLETLHKRGSILEEMSVWSMNTPKLVYFLSQLKKYSSVQGSSPLLLEEEDPVHRCFVDASINNLTVILNHGFEQKFCQRQLKWYLKCILTRKKEYCDDAHFSFWYNYFHAYDIYDTDYLWRRLYLTLQMLYVILHRMFTGLRRCLRILWKTIPDPYITAEELELVTREMPVRKKMTKSFDAFLNSGKYNEVKNYVNRPRDLKHYARCTIRSCLIRSRRLPEGVRNLDLPKELQSYLLLESAGTRLD